MYPQRTRARARARRRRRRWPLFLLVFAIALCALGFRVKPVADHMRGIM